MPFTFKLAKRLARLKQVVVPGLAVLASCEKPLPLATGGDPSPVMIVVTPDSVALDPGQTQQFQAYGRTGAGASVPATVNWSTSVGTITASGLYTADTSATDAVVTATLSGSQLTGKGKVVKRRLVRVVLIPTGVTLSVGGAQQFSVYGRDNTGDSVSVSVGYTATGGSITPAGLYTAGSVPGAFQVMANATRSSLADTASVAVSGVPVASVAVSPATANLFVGGTVQLTATAKDSAGNVLAGRAITWSTGAPTVASVSTSGKVTGVAVGSATITATSEGKSGTATVTATLVPVASVTVSPASASISVGGTTQLTATARDSAGNPLTGRSITWTSGNPSAATVSGSGLVTGVAAGTATIIATSEGKSATAAVTITAAATCVSTVTMLCPGDNIQAKATAAGAGATLTLQPGIYRLQTVIPLANQTFVGQPGAIMSGAKLLTGWVQSGSTWYVTGQTQQFADNVGTCRGSYPCQYQEDVYRDNVLLQRVTSLSALGPGAFFFDYVAQRMYVGDDPTGHTVEAAATEYAFEGSPQGVGSGVTVQGLVIEKYANPAQYGAVGHANMGANWILRNCEIRYNHGGGIRGGAGVVAAHNYVHHNGQIGFIGYFAHVDSNEIAVNNTAHFAEDWEAGGAKFVRTQNLVVRGNFVHDNHGRGLWTDTDNDGVIYDANTVQNNEWDGIMHEVSYSATITNNVITGNGAMNPNGAEGAGIMIMSSGGTGIDVSGNTLVGNKNAVILIQSNRGSGTLGPYVTQNVNVHDNTVTLGTGQRHGADYYGGNTGLWSTNNNGFIHNTYNLQTADASPFLWTNNALLSDTQWRAAGNDLTGTFNH